MNRKTNHAVVSSPEQADGKSNTRFTPKPKGEWRKLAGSMDGCDLHAAAMRAGAAWRDRMNRQGK